MVRSKVVLFVVGAAALCLAGGSAGAAFIDMGLTNGNFSTGGTLALGSSVAIGANSGSADNDALSSPANRPKLFQDWRVLGAATSGTGYSTADGMARLYKGAANGKNETPILVHDALKKEDGSYWTIAAAVYKLEFQSMYSSYNYKSYASILYGDTDRASNTTWKSGSYFNFPTPAVWYPTAEFGYAPSLSMQTFTLYWDNTGSTNSTPWGGGPIPANTAIVYTGAANQRIGEHIRVSFAGSQNGTGTNTSLYIDNVSLSVTPEPATLSLLALGGLAVLRRSRKS